ncbi:MAG: ribonuclease PH [Candidatus Gastranaerophilales bacterium]|nr:ribonuclease PH [Candidatus Gastranaerophilales bacterium]
MRIDSRKNEDLRPIKFTHDFTKHALGSVLVEFGETKVLVCANFEDAIPKWMDKDSSEGWLSAEYSLLPSSTETRCQRERNKISGRTQEIQRLIGRSLRACLNLEKIKGKTFIIDADVIQADGGTRTASICGAYVAVCDMVKKLLEKGLIEENPIIEPIGAISAGIVNNEVMVDLCYQEDSNAQVDSNIVLTASGKIIEFQTTAEGLPFEKSQLDEIYNIAKKSIDKIISMY